MRPYCGVNLSKSDDLDLAIKERRKRWMRIWFGFKSSPYLAVVFLAIAEEQARGYHLYLTNPFYWNEVKLN